MRKRHIIGAWLSLFAMLMIFSGPLISQGISLAHGKSRPKSMAGMECHDILGTGQKSQHASAGKTHDLVVWEKCGYWSLLFQHPALADSNLSRFQLNVPPLQLFYTHIIPQQAAPLIFLGARSRAPPIRSLNVIPTFG